VGQIAVSRDGSRAVSGGTDREPRVWDLDPPRLVRTLPRHPGWVQGCDFSPDGAFVATGCRDGVIRIFDIASGEEQRKLVGHIGRTWDVKYDPTGMVASAGADGTLRRWDPRIPAGARGLRTFRIPGAPEPTDKIRGRRVAVGIMAMPSGTAAAVLSLHGRTVIADIASGALTTIPSGATASAFNIAVDGRGARFAAVPTSGLIEVHALPALKPHGAATSASPGGIMRLPHVDGAVTSDLAWLPSGRLVAGCTDGRLLEWDASLATAREVDRLGRTIDAVCLAPTTAKQVAVAAGPRMLVYSLPLSNGGGRTLVTLPPDEGIVIALAWSPDERRIAYGTTQGQVSIIDARSGQVLKALTRHTSDVAGIAWPPDDRTLVTANAECVRFTDIATATTLDEMRPGWNVESLDFMSGHGHPLLVIAGSEAAAGGEVGRASRLGILDLGFTLDGGSP
jgi:WD40 repeat protein